MPNVRERLICALGKSLHYGYGTLCLIAEELMAEGVTEQEWISVKDGLPEQRQEVIVYSGGVLKPTVFAYQFWNKHYDSWARITHWMPLPKPPKEGEG